MIIYIHHWKFISNDIPIDIIHLCIYISFLIHPVFHPLHFLPCRLRCLQLGLPQMHSDAVLVSHLCFDCLEHLEWLRSELVVICPDYTGWWYTYPSEKYDFVSWDDDIPNWLESHKIPWFQSPPTSIVNHSDGINHWWSPHKIPWFQTSNQLFIEKIGGLDQQQTSCCGIVRQQVGDEIKQLQEPELG